MRASGRSRLEERATMGMAYGSAQVGVARQMAGLVLASLFALPEMRLRKVTTRRHIIVNDRFVVAREEFSDGEGNE